GDPLADKGEVVVGTGDADGEQCGAGGDEVVGHLLRRPGDSGGPLDLGRVATDLFAPLVEDAAFVLDRGRVAEPVPDVGVLRGVAQGLALTTPPISTGMSRVGGGFSFVQRFSMRGSASAKSASRLA